MSQTDYSIANQSGALFRVDLNATLDAIVTNNSGATEPASTFAYMLWMDTTSGILKQRNAANTAWISKVKIAQSLINVDNTADADKPISTATQAALNAKEPADATILKDADIGTTVQAYDTDLDTVATVGIGTDANQIVQLDASAKLPAVDGSQLTGISTAPTTSQVLNATAGASFQELGSYALGVSSDAVSDNGNYSASTFGLSGGTWKVMNSQSVVTGFDTFGNAIYSYISVVLRVA